MLFRSGLRFDYGDHSSQPGTVGPATVSCFGGPESDRGIVHIHSAAGIPHAFPRVDADQSSVSNTNFRDGKDPS